ncbi:MAG: DUF134 domain-containing protein [Eubacterium sp.]
MARPKKSRCICAFPKSMEFKPFGEYAEIIDLTFDEYEAFRLIDYLDFSQEECARQMEVARSTVAAIYQSARKKIADAIVNGKALEIHGGDVELCPSHGNCCGRCGQNICGNCNHGSCPDCKNNITTPEACSNIN